MNPKIIYETDYTLLATPLLNKGTAFTDAERDAFGLHGLLPPYVATIDEQRKRSYTAFQAKSSDLGKYIYLRDLQDSNETLFYNLVTNHIAEMMPIIYTPTVGDGCMNFGRIYRRPRGLFISYPNRHRIDQMLAHRRFDNVEVIVVSDGERILGLGDQGAGGMGIPIGKLALYTACAGIYPGATLPILLDSGTNNLGHRNDPLYLGWRNERIRGKEYDEFIELFVQAVERRFPHVLVQWEDFAQTNATPILTRYRDQLCTFNDDIQGTAAIATGVLLAAVRAAGTKISDQKVVVVGSGSAGCGISSLMLQAMVDEGLSKEEARQRFFLIDRKGLLMESAELFPFQKIFAHSSKDVAHWKREKPGEVSLKETIQNVQPTLLIGVSGQGGLFTEELIREMASHVKRPLIFPLSNPTNCSEATPEDLMKWTDGRALIGTGSPFPNITKNGKSIRVDQTNNAYIFPGLGLGVIAVKARRITDPMFMAAAKALADCSPSKIDPQANLLPPLSQIREISFKIALAVAQEAIKEREAEPCKDLEQKIQQKMWIPNYVPYKRAL